MLSVQGTKCPGSNLCFEVRHCFPLQFRTSTAVASTLNGTGGTVGENCSSLAKLAKYFYK